MQVSVGASTRRNLRPLWKSLNKRSTRRTCSETTGRHSTGPARSGEYVASQRRLGPPGAVKWFALCPMYMARVKCGTWDGVVARRTIMSAGSESRSQSARPAQPARTCSRHDLRNSVARRKRMRISYLLLAWTLLCSPLARGDPWQYELLLMPSAQAVGTFDRQAPVTEIVDEVVQIDTLFTVQRGPFKLFGEYLVSDHEHDLERFQLGWQATQDTVVWIGRYHQPTSVWNHDHHHGQYLQTSVSRPFLDEWEDLGGILPQHFTGILVESGHKAFGSWRLRTAIAGGLAPIITPDGLEPFDLLHPDSKHHQVGFQARASLHPGEFTESGFGLVV